MARWREPTAGRSTSKRLPKRRFAASGRTASICSTNTASIPRCRSKRPLARWVTWSNKARCVSWGFRKPAPPISAGHTPRTQIEIASARAYPQITAALAHVNIARAGLNIAALHRTDVHLTSANVDVRLSGDVLDVNVPSCGNQREIGAQTSDLHISTAAGNFHRPIQIVERDRTSTSRAQNRSHDGTKVERTTLGFHFQHLQFPWYLHDEISGESVQVSCRQPAFDDVAF